MNERPCSSISDPGRRGARPPFPVPRTARWLLAFALTLASARPAAATFGTDVAVSGGPYSRFLCAPNAHAVASDSRQNVHLIYGGFELRHGYDQEVVPYYRMYDQRAGTWSPEVEICDPADRVVCWWKTAITTDCNDNAHMVWVQMGENFVYRMRAADGVWGPIEVIPTPPGEAETPAVAADSHGNVFVCWANGAMNTDGTLLYNIVCSVRDAALGAWSAPFALTSYSVGGDPSPGARFPSIAVQGFDGTDDTAAHLAWRDDRAGDTAYTWIKFHYLATGGWVEILPSPVHLAGAPGVPSLAVRCRTVHIAWSEGGVLRHRIGTMTGQPGAVAFAPAAATGIAGADPNICVDGLGNVQAALATDTGIAHARWSAASQTWSLTGTVDDTDAWTERPSAAVDPLGDVHVIWMDGRAPSAQHVYYDHGGCLTVPMAPGLPESPVPVLPPAVQALMATAAESGRIDVILQMREQIDVRSLEQAVAGLTPRERQRSVVTRLAEFAQASQARILDDLATASARGEAEGIEPLWLVNAVGARVSPSYLADLATRPDIEAIILNERTQIEGSRRSGDRTGGGAAPAQPAADPPPFPPPPANVAWNVTWIGAPDVWDLGYRGQCVLVAVLDTGIDDLHPDLAGRLWRNGGEVPANGSDDDGNGFVDDVNGFDFAYSIDGNGDGRFDNPADFVDPLPDDQHGHGTHVSGTVAGDGTSGTITGVAPEASVMSVKVCDDGGACSDLDILLGIQYAIENGAQILNLSLGGRCRDAAARRLFRLQGDVVYATGVTMCVAAGNGHCEDLPANEIDLPGDIPPPWISPWQPPVAGMRSGVTTVGATDYRTDVIADYSARGPVDWSQTDFPYGDWRLCDPAAPNTGLIKPDLSAPGSRVLSCALGGGYVGETPPNLWSGTSMATPHVAGLAALLLSKNHALLSPDIEEILETSAVDLGDVGKDNAYGAGRIDALPAIAATPVDAGSAVTLLSHEMRDSTGGDGDGRMEAGEEVDLLVTLRNEGPYLLGDVVATLDVSGTVVLLDDTAYYGDFLVHETKTNVDDTFRVRVPDDAPDGAIVDFTLNVSGYGACGTWAFSDTVHAEPCVHIVDHDAGGVRFSVTDQGIAGFLDGTQAVGSGFVFPKSGGTNRLYIGSLWAATDSTYALNRDYAPDPAVEWATIGCLALRSGQPGDPLLADEIAIGGFDDAGAAAPRGLVVLQRSYAWSAPPNDDYVILTYDVVNAATETLRDLWLGLFMDWDLDGPTGYEENRGRVETDRDLVYMWRPSGGDGAHVGIRSLTHTHPLQMSLIHNPTYVWPRGYVTDGDRFRFLSGAPGYNVTDTPSSDDWSAVIGVAPFTIDPGDTVRIAFAVLAGSSLADLRANADAAAARWAAAGGPVTGVPPPAGPDTAARLELLAPIPNPFLDTIALAFRLPHRSAVRLEVFDLAGRRVAGLVDAVRDAGEHRINWAGADDGGTSLPGGVYHARLLCGADARTVKIVLAR